MNKEHFTYISDMVQTPAYIFEGEEFSKRAVDAKIKLGKDIDICYSIKANPFLIDDMFGSSSLFDKLEVCSIGELHICANCDTSPEKIVFSGINKNANEVEEAYRYGVRIFTIESYNHLNCINSVGEIFGDILPVIIRISADSQFGMDESDVIDIIANRKQYQNINIIGIHYFTGTQKRSANVINKEILFLKDFCERVSLKLGFKIQNVEYGAGLNVDYFVGQMGGATILEEIGDNLKSLASITKVTIEMGRYFAATCGYYFTKVVDCKTNNGTNYAVVDGGMNQLHYDGQVKNMKIPFHFHLKQEHLLADSSYNIHKWTICGSICSAEDVICRDVELDDLKIGDIIIFRNCGAYSFMEGMSTFLSREMPQIWGYTNNKLELLRDFIYTDRFNCRMQNKTKEQYQVPEGASKFITEQSNLNTGNNVESL